jgi:O-antigen/teichoic acid export membrane protein
MSAYFRSVVHWLDFRNQVYNTTLFVVSTVFSIVMVWLVTTYMAPHEYGIYQYVLAVVALASITALPGIGSMLSSYVARGQHGVPSELNAFSFKTGMVGVAILGGAAAYERVVSDNQDAAVLMAFAAAVFLPHAIYARYESVFAGLQRFRELLLLRTVAMGVQLASGLIVLVVLRRGYVAFGITQLTVEVVTSWYFFRLACRHLLNTQTDPGAVRHGVILSAVDAGGTLLNPAVQLYVNMALGPSALALFTIAKRITEQVGGLVKPLVKPISIKLTRQGSDEHSSAMVRLVPAAVVLGAALYGCLLLGLTYVGPLIIAEPYHLSLQYTKLFGLIFLVSPLYVLLSNNLIFERHSKALAACVYTEQALRLGGYVAFVGRYGIPAVALVNTVSVTVQVVLMFVFLLRRRLRPDASAAVAAIAEAPATVGQGHAR